MWCKDDYNYGDGEGDNHDDDNNTVQLQHLEMGTMTTNQTVNIWLWCHKRLNSTTSGRCSNARDLTTHNLIDKYANHSSDSRAAMFATHSIDTFTFAIRNVLRVFSLA